MGRQGQRDSGEALAQAAKAYIEAHSAEKFSLEKLSGALYINGCYLSRQFKSHMGQTLLEYHNRVRCERALTLLQNTEMSISEVSAAVGFVSCAHFSHVFKKIMNCTPSACRPTEQR